MDISRAKHAFITGGASGLGLAIGNALADRGLCVTLADVDEAALAAAVAGQEERMRGIRLDTRDRVQWQDARLGGEAAFGPVDILVNNAGIGPDGSELADMDPLAWDRIIAINLTGVFNGAATFAATMQERGCGFIVNTASITGLSPGFSGRGGYAAAKAGVVAISEGLRAELAPRGIGVAALCPGLVPTNLGYTTVKLGSGVMGTNLDMPDIGVSAEMVAEMVLRGIEEDRSYIVTHPTDVTRVEARTAQLRQAHQVPVPNAPLGQVLDTAHLRHAFVTGGASGIGLGIADALLAQGLHVTIADIDDQALAATVSQRGEAMHGLILDVRDRAGWAAAKEDAEKRFGPVDILVNNAGITADGSNFAEMDPHSWDRIIAIDLTGVFNGVSTFAAEMRARGYGHIVNTASVVGLVTAMAGMGGYAAAKNGVIALSEGLRTELADHGVGVTCLCPGYVQTNLHANTIKAGGHLSKADRAANQASLPLQLVGACVVEAIATNHPFALTHPAHWPAVEMRQKAILAAWPVA
jgi:NAD(P)-dependent dehydrogenase (short-subunit alcohol dehydrogenase family)